MAVPPLIITAARAPDMGAPRRGIKHARLMNYAHQQCGISTIGEHCSHAAASSTPVRPSVLWRESGCRKRVTRVSVETMEMVAAMAAKRDPS
jgi:hypothetical protein